MTVGVVSFGEIQRYDISFVEGMSGASQYVSQEACCASRITYGRIGGSKDIQPHHMELVALGFRVRGWSP